MTFQSLDITPYSSNPIELYWFTHVEASVTYEYWYTSSDTDFYDGTTLWKADPISHEEFEISSLLERIGLTINVAQDNPVARKFLNVSPPTPISIRLYQAMRNDPEHQTIFVGTVKTCSFEDEEARIHCESVQTSIRKTGLQRAHSRSCNHVLYDPATCKATSAPYLSTGIITAVENAGQRIKMTLVPDRPADWFTAGELIHPDGPRTMVLTHTNIGGGVHQMDLIRPATGLPGTGSVTMTAGCKRTYDVCQGKFNNTVNFGGFPFAPVTNPFETSFFN